MPIITPDEYRALKAAGKIRLSKTPAGKIAVDIDRGEYEELNKAAILAWLAAERTSHTDQVAILDEIKTDVEAIP